MRVTVVTRHFHDSGAGYVAEEVETSERSQKFLATFVVGERFGVGRGHTSSVAKARAYTGFLADNPRKRRKA